MSLLSMVCHGQIIDNRSRPRYPRGVKTLGAQAVVGGLSFLLLDAVWLGVLMNAFYRHQLAPIVRLSDGGIAPNWAGAGVVYVLLGLGLAVFVGPKASSAGSAAVYGGLFGLVVYGVYDFTNFATLRQWPLVVAMVDVGWGIAISALSAVAVWAVSR